MGMFILGWLLTGAIFSFGGMVLIRRWYNEKLTYGDLALAGFLSLLGPLVIFMLIANLVSWLNTLTLWETPVFKKDR